MGVVGLVIGGGFGSFFKVYGSVVLYLLEVEVVIVDGCVWVVNVDNDVELFWVLKGGCGVSFGVVICLIFCIYVLLDIFGGVLLVVWVDSDGVWYDLVVEMLCFYCDVLCNLYWGE